MEPGSHRVQLGALADNPWDRLIDLEVSLDRGLSRFTTQWRLTRTARREQDLLLANPESLLSQAKTHVLLRVPELVDVQRCRPGRRPMKRMFLIVETPRAGDFGHRFLVPPRIATNASSPRSVEDAARNPVGRCHVAVARSKPSNRLSSGSVRSGSESPSSRGYRRRRPTRTS